MRDDITKPYQNDWLIVCEPLFCTDTIGEIADIIGVRIIDSHWERIVDYCNAFGFKFEPNKHASKYSSGERLIVFFAAVATLMTHKRKPSQLLLFNCIHFLSEQNRTILLKTIYPSPFTAVLAISSKGRTLLKLNTGS